MGVFVVFLPPPRPPRIRTSVRMVDAIVELVDRERKDTPNTGWTGWRAHGHRRRRRLRIRNGWRRRWWGRTTVSGFAGVKYQWSHASILDATCA